MIGPITKASVRQRFYSGDGGFLHFFGCDVETLELVLKRMCMEAGSDIRLHTAWSSVRRGAVCVGPATMKKPTISVMTLAVCSAVSAPEAKETTIASYSSGEAATASATVRGSGLQVANLPEDDG